MIANNLNKVRQTIPNNVLLVAVSKTKPIAFIEEAYQEKQLHFGENKALEMKDKAEQLANDISWHFIGHLQRNKVKFIVPSVFLIHSIDSLRLLQEVNKQALKNNRVVNCLLQFHIAKETTKFGFSLEEANLMIKGSEFSDLKNIKIIGVMGMATFSDNEELVKTEFQKLKSIFDNLKFNLFKEDDEFKEISMGMSGDYKLAIREGATIVRVGSSIFGSRK